MFGERSIPSIKKGKNNLIQLLMKYPIKELLITIENQHYRLIFIAIALFAFGGKEANDETI